MVAVHFTMLQKTRYIHKFVGNTALMSMSMFGDTKVTAANADSKKAK